MEHLAARGVACPAPVHGRDGEALRALCGRPAALVSFLDGVSPRRVDAGHCSALGRALARLHLAGRRLSHGAAEQVSVASWRPLFAAGRAGADDLLPGLEGEVARKLDHLERHGPPSAGRRDPRRPVSRQRVLPGPALSGIIDFYFACIDIIAYDLAICLNAWCFEPDGAFNITKARQMLAAYRALRPFTGAELAALPLLARGAAMRFLLTRLFDWQKQVAGALVRPKDPLEFLGKLRFHRGLSGPGAYGLD